MKIWRLKTCPHLDETAEVLSVVLPPQADPCGYEAVEEDERRVHEDHRQGAQLPERSLDQDFMIYHGEVLLRDPFCYVEPSAQYMWERTLHLPPSLDDYRNLEVVRIRDILQRVPSSCAVMRDLLRTPHGGDFSLRVYWWDYVTWVAIVDSNGLFYDRKMITGKDNADRVQQMGEYYQERFRSTSTGLEWCGGSPYSETIQSRMERMSESGRAHFLQSVQLKEIDSADLSAPYPNSCCFCRGGKGEREGVSVLGFGISRIMIPLFHRYRHMGIPLVVRPESIEDASCIRAELWEWGVRPIWHAASYLAAELTERYPDSVISEPTSRSVYFDLQGGTVRPNSKVWVRRVRGESDRLYQYPSLLDREGRWESTDPVLFVVVSKSRSECVRHEKIWRESSCIPKGGGRGEQ